MIPKWASIQCYLHAKMIKIYICYYVNSEKIKWIGTRTTYDNLIDLLENKITIRDAFLNVTNNNIEWLKLNKRDVIRQVFRPA